MSTAQPIVRRPRVFGIALITSVVLAAQYAAQSWLAYDLAKRDDGDLDFWHQVVLRHVNPFAGYLFGPRLDADYYVPWLVGALVALLVFFVIVGIVCRAGVVAAFVGAWLATSLAGTAGVLASVYVQVKSTDIGSGSLSSQLVAAFSYGPHWALLFGWVTALFAAFFTATLRKKVGSPYDEQPAAERTTSAYADLPE